MDNKNTEGNTDPVGPVRRFAGRAGAGCGSAGKAPWPRWLPPDGDALWQPRKRKGADTLVPWGLIGGDKATQDPTPANATHATNLADEIEADMRDKYGMVFTSEPIMSDIATYTHG